MSKKFKEVEKLIGKGEDLAKDFVPKAMDTLSDIKDTAVNMYEKGLEGAQHFLEKGDKSRVEAMEIAEKKMKETRKAAVKGADEVRKMASKRADEVVDFASARQKDVLNAVPAVGTSYKKKRTGKVVAGTAVAALAAASYAYYMNKKMKNDKLKEDYSVKMKRWSELDETELETEAGENMEPVRIIPKKVYMEGTNAKLTDGIVVRIAKPEEGRAFNPHEEGKLLAGIDFVSTLKDKASTGMTTIKKKMEEAKVQTKLGAMEAKDKMEEMRDKVGDIDITDKVRGTVEEARMQAHLGTMETKDKFEELKEKSAELKREVESDYNAATGRLSEDSAEGFTPNIDSDGTYTENKMADEDLGDKVDNLKDKAKDKFEDAKDKVEDAVGEPSENRDPSGYYSENIQGMRGQAGYDKNDWNDSSANLGMNDTSNRFEDLNTDTEAKLEDIEKTVRVGPQDGDSVGMESDIYIEEKSSVPFEPYGEERYEDMSHKSKEVMDKMKDVKDTVAEKITTAADTVMNKVRPETPYYEKELVEYEVIIHNGGNDDYFFNPLLIQKYDVKKKNVDIKPFHKKGTTLESKVIQPGETYTATLMVEKEIGKSEGLVVFEDVMMDNASLILLKDSTTDVDEFEQELFGYTDEDDIE